MANKIRYRDTISVSELIESESDKIIQNIKHESIDVYKFLKREYSKGDLLRNYLFQFVFRSFYRIDNAGLTDQFKKKFFQWMDSVSKSKEFDYKKILKDLYKYPSHRGLNTVQFSFLTKLFNTIDDTVPIYDNEVRSIFSMSTVYHIKEVDQKIDRYLAQLEIIELAYKEIVDRNLLPITIKTFDSRFPSNELPVIKKLDFIFWSAGKLID